MDHGIPPRFSNGCSFLLRRTYHRDLTGKKHDADAELVIVQEYQYKKV
jgi:hypothetical protein